MKKLIFTAAFVAWAMFSWSQSYSVKADDAKSTTIIQEALKKLNKAQAEDGDITLELVLRQTSKINSMYKGYVVAKDKAGKELGRTKEVRRGAVAINGFNASANIAEVIVEKHLTGLINGIRK